MSNFLSKMKKNNNQGPKLNNRIFKMITKEDRFKYLEVPFHCYVKFEQDIDNPEEINLWKNEINKKGYPDILKWKKEFNWTYIDIDELFKNEDNHEFLKLLDSKYKTDWFYQKRIDGFTGYKMEDIPVKYKLEKKEEKEERTNILMKLFK